MASIFISHSSTDARFAAWLSEQLARLGHTPWLDAWKIRVGQCITSEVSKGIESCDFVVVVLSEESVRSEWVDREWKAKYWEEIQHRDTLILPVLLSDCEIPHLLRNRRFADFRDDRAIGLVELAASLSPALPIAEVPSSGFPSTDSARRRRVTNVLHAAQDPTTRLSDCVARSLELAVEIDEPSLVAWCKAELAGIRPTSENRSMTGPPRHRIVRTFVSVGSRLNLQYEGWGQNAASVIEFLKQNPRQFPECRFVIPEAINELEVKVKSNAGRRGSIVVNESRQRAFFPDSENPDMPVYFYIDPQDVEEVLHRTRTELISRLVELLS